MAALPEVYYYFSYSERLRYVDTPEVIANEVKQSIEIATLARRSASARRHVAPAPGNDYFLLSFAIDTCQAASALHKTSYSGHINVHDMNTATSLECVHRLFT